ncbi:oxidoreductase [Bacillus sp. B15-48]|uniref:oxidoreductase n=1 Tax=Bacillus sp. B15-48 TaxID=1548601 RepID=UPI00193FBB84|nr:oxidoreductase [Bacillus sp. B15-48]MBM4760925.1 NAD-dependent epimerase/dehydratase family protein [Bacillus sp. B15-48]
MQTKQKTALLIGATGLVGQELLKILLETSLYEKIIVLTRRKVNVQHPKLLQIVAGFDQLANHEADYSVDDVYCCLGTTIKKAGSQEEFKKVDYTYPVELAKLTKQAGATSFLIISALGADPHSKIFYNRTKGAVEEAIKSVGFPALHIFQPSLLLGDRQEFRFGEKVGVLLSPVYSPFMVGTLKKYKPIQAADVAQAMFYAGQLEETGIFTYPSDEIFRLSKKTAAGG